MVVFVYCVSQMSAQQTGAWETTITFKGEKRAVAFQVPTTYNPGQKYRLIIALHGKGWTASDYRNSLANLSKNSDYATYNCILACPYGGNVGDPDQNFHYPVGDEEFIKVTLDSVKSWYNIDPNYIYLQGFSLGGRSALAYGLEHYEWFTSLHLWTPAVQTLDEAKNLTSKIKFKYSNATQIPSCITIGTGDDTFYAPVKLAKDSLVAAGGMVHYIEFLGGHASPAKPLIIECTNFLDSASAVLADVELMPVETFDRMVKIFPNPVQEKINFVTEIARDEIKEVSVFDMYGKMIIILKSNQLNYKNEIDVSQLSMGQYLIKISSAKGDHYAKFVKN